MAEALRLPDDVVRLRGEVGKQEPGAETIVLSVENMRCGGCMSSIERTLRALPGVNHVRANLTAKRVSVAIEAGRLSTDAIVEALAQAGYTAAPLRDDTVSPDAAYLDDLLRRLAVAGFGSANIMLLSVAVWAGIASDMDKSLQTLFHWLSALIALPVIAYSGMPFFGSALTALSARRLNMDVPISLGILLATAMSVFQTLRGTEQVYFDAAVMLTFFLLIGRFLDERMRTTARGAAQNLMAFKALTASVIGRDGTLSRMDGRLVEAGMRILVPRGERIPVDAEIDRGCADIDESLITGEMAPRAVGPGDVVHAGTLNLSASIEVVARSSSDTSLLAEIARLMEAAEQNRGLYRRLADRAAQTYAPVVHLLGVSTFAGWMIAGAPWEQALTYAIAVLIITCPCALALAVPAVQVAATSRLFDSGIIIKAPDALERLAMVDTIVLDKTGTLTTGTMRLINGTGASDEVLAKAAGLAANSRHPYARAIVEEAKRRGIGLRPADGVEEIAGAGLRRHGARGVMQLGSSTWVGGVDAPGLWFRDEDGSTTAFSFTDSLRPDAQETLERLRRSGYGLEILSGDRRDAVGKVAGELGVSTWKGEVKPDEKLFHIEALRGQGREVLMVGDGLNDAPALAAGRASLSPASATDIAQTAADGVMQGERLSPVAETLAVARAAQALALQNFAISIAYNIVCVPLAVAGYVTPLIAALAMSASSIAVTANAVRLRVMRFDGEGSRSGGAS
jgi:P-type Cu2+ transporter